MRLCIDYCALSQLTVKNKYPFLRVDELFDQLARELYFKKVDLRPGYHQCRIQEQDIPKFVFQTSFGLYNFLVMSFGLTNTPTSFMTHMDNVWKLYIMKFVVVFLDDILIHS